MGWPDHLNEELPVVLLEALKGEASTPLLAGLSAAEDDLGGIAASLVEVIVEAAERLWAYQRQDDIVFLQVSDVMRRLGLNDWNCPFGRRVYHRLEKARDGVATQEKAAVAAIIERAKARRNDDATRPAAKPETDWHDVSAKLIRLYENGEQFTSQREFAKRLECSVATVNKAINDSDRLKGWMARQRRRAPRAQSMNDFVLDSTISHREADPSNAGLPNDEVERIMALLLERAKPAERAKLNALTVAERREMAQAYMEQKTDIELEDDTPGGSRITGRKP